MRHSSLKGTFIEVFLSCYCFFPKQSIPRITVCIIGNLLISTCLTTLLTAIILLHIFFYKAELKVTLVIIAIILADHLSVFCNVQCQSFPKCCSERTAFPYVERQFLVMINLFQQCLPTVHKKGALNIQTVLQRRDCEEMKN